MSASLTAISNLLWDVFVQQSIGRAIVGFGDDRRVVAFEPEALRAFGNTLQEHEIEAMSVGGSATNAAIAYAELGGEARVCGPVADDCVGHCVLKDLEQYSIQLVNTAPKPKSSGLCLCCSEGGADRRFAVSYPSIIGDSVAPESELRWTNQDWLVTSVYELWTKPMQAMVLSEIRKARQAGARIALDLGDSEIVRLRWRALFEMLASGVDVLQLTEECLSAVEEAWLKEHGSLADMSKCCGRLIITSGSGTLDFRCGATRTEFEIPQVVVRDSTGAGDALLGTFLWGISQEDSETRSMQRAIAVAKEVVGVLGTRLPTDEWLKFL